MKVTINTILLGEEYDRLPGTSYEVAIGHEVTTKPPTIGLKERAIEEAQRLAKDEAKYSDVKLAKFLSDGTWPDEEGAVLDQVATRLVNDWLFTAGLTSKEAKPSSPTSAPSAQAET